jgi:hypothetical protein
MEGQPTLNKQSRKVIKTLRVFLFIKSIKKGLQGQYWNPLGSAYEDSIA